MEKDFVHNFTKVMLEYLSDKTDEQIKAFFRDSLNDNHPSKKDFTEGKLARR